MANVVAMIGTVRLIAVMDIMMLMVALIVAIYRFPRWQ